MVGRGDQRSLLGEVRVTLERAGRGLVPFIVDIIVLDIAVYRDYRQTLRWGGRDECIDLLRWSKGQDN